MPPIETNPMLVRAYIHNFRTFVNFEVRLGAMQLLMGPNGAGKTALLEVVDRIRRLVCTGERIHDAFPLTERSAGLSGTEGNMRVELDLQDWDGGLYRYGVEIEVDEDQGLQRIGEEWLNYQGKPLFHSERGEAHLYRDDHSKGPDFPMDWSLSGVGFLMSSRSNRLLTAFKDRLERYYLLRLQPSDMRTESRHETVRPETTMANLPDWYRHLVQAQPDRIHEVTQDLRSRLAGFRTLRLLEAGEGKKLLADFDAEEGGTITLSFSALSDGQRALIALYTALRAIPSEKGATLAIDEPENFLALPEIQPWLDELSDAAEDQNLQVMLISHHPRLLNFLAAEQGIWLERDSGTGPTRQKTIGATGTDAQINVDQLVERGWLVNGSKT